MRAFAVRKFGEAPTILDLPIPSADGAVLIRVKCAGVNPIDYKLVERLTAASTFPFVLGADFAGVVESVAAGERDFRVGDRIFGMSRTHGAYVDQTAVVPGAKTEPLAHIPDGVTDEQAAALPIPGITALASLNLLGFSAGQRVVVMGATGGVGGYAVQMARARGAHVIATVRGDADEARKLGAEEVYDSKAVDVIKAIHAAHPEGVDGVFDLINGKDVIGRDAEILKAGGSVVSTVYAADEKWFAERKITAHNISSTNNPLSTPDGLNQVMRLLADGTITARVRSIVGLDGAAQIIEKLRNGGLRGKAVIRL
ncbi:MAG TPA: NADP-dependent oxidoreductase [Candidatus Acidoferrales bacterium]|nr:NADP-dependent oxidoreductase [Candidatus Acidoferrales bacterium]